MLRGYPRFFISNVDYGTTPGKFIIHALEPFIVMRLYEGQEHEDFNGTNNIHQYYDDFTLELLTLHVVDAPIYDAQIAAFRAAGKWYKYLPKPEPYTVKLNLNNPGFNPDDLKDFAKDS